MKKALWKIPAGLSALALAAALAGCPVAATQRNTDMGGGGSLFGDPEGTVVMTVTRIPAVLEDHGVTVTLTDTNTYKWLGSADGTVNDATVTVTMQNISFSGAETMVTITDGNTTATMTTFLSVGENIVTVSDYTSRTDISVYGAPSNIGYQVYLEVRASNGESLWGDWLQVSNDQIYANIQNISFPKATDVDIAIGYNDPDDGYTMLYARDKALFPYGYLSLSWGEF